MCVFPFTIGPNNRNKKTDSYKNKMRSKDESHITPRRENMVTLIGEIFNMAVIDSGRTNSLWKYLAPLIFGNFNPH